MHDPRSVALKENLLAMKDTAGSSGSLLFKSPVRAGFAMIKSIVVGTELSVLPHIFSTTQQEGKGV